MNTVRLYAPPRRSESSQPVGPIQPRGPSQEVCSSQPVGSSSKPATRARNIVPTVEKTIEVLEANQRKRKKPEWEKY